MVVITYPCWDWSYSLLVEGALDMMKYHLWVSLCGFDYIGFGWNHVENKCVGWLINKMRIMKSISDILPEQSCFEGPCLNVMI